VSCVHQLAVELSVTGEPAAGEENTVAPPVIGVLPDIREAEVIWSARSTSKEIYMETKIYGECFPVGPET